MPAKKAASKKHKRAGSGRKATASKKSTTGKKAAGKKQRMSTKKSSTKKASKKKTAARKKPAASSKTAKKSTKKSAAKNRARKKATKKVSKKSAKSAGSTTARKKPAARPSAKKSATSKKSGQKTAGKAVSTKKLATAQPARKAAVTAANGSARRPSRQDLLAGPIHGIEPYAMRRGEEYMSPEQLEHFRSILTAWKRELMNEVDRTVHHMQDEAANFPDPNDRATQESEFGLELRTRDRERKLLRKIDAALARIDDGTYGYCDETGEEIGLKRLEARPVATLSLEAQERRELAERQFRDRDDRYR